MYCAKLVHFPTGGTRGFPRLIGKAGWEENLLAQSIPFEDFWNNQKETMKDDHSKVTIYHGEDPVGIILLVPAEDAHVGQCLLAYHQFLLPEHRGSHRLWASALKLAAQAARDRGVSHLVTSRQVPGSRCTKYIYTYKEV